ncbi:MAG: hypothetical protein R3E95_08705 [Thiolinea sp.]
MFFNRNSKIMRHLLGGDLTPVLENRIDSDGHNGLAPISPLPPETVRDWLPELDWNSETGRECAVFMTTVTRRYVNACLRMRC